MSGAYEMAAFHFPETDADRETYWGWFKAEMPFRREQLTSEVRRMTTYATWIPNLSRDSLRQLSVWFDSQVQGRQRTQDEIARLVETMKFVVPVSNIELTDRTLSLALDVGMYLGDALLHAVSGLHWGLMKGGRKSADFRWPLILGGRVPINPLNAVVISAKGVLKGERSDLDQLYDRLVHREQK